MNQKWQALIPGDRVYILAPSAKTVDFNSELRKCCAFLERWQLVPVYSEHLFGQGPNYYSFANTHEKRYQDLMSVLARDDIKAIWCFRGGYGCDRVLQQLHAQPMIPPKNPILLIGFSDITLLHGYFNQTPGWHWPSLHASSLGQLARNEIDENDVQTMKNILFGHTEQVTLAITPYNRAAQITSTIHGRMTGGNCTLLRSSLGTPWNIDCDDAIVLLEEVSEEPRKVAAMLVQLCAQHLRQSKAIVLGDFIADQAADTPAEYHTLMTAAINDVLQDYPVPVFHCAGIGHGSINHPIPLNTLAELTATTLSIQTGVTQVAPTLAL
jgi:muramoyltetrapeptide carboxypeptidase